MKIFILFTLFNVNNFINLVLYFKAVSKKNVRIYHEFIFMVIIYIILIYTFLQLIYNVYVTIVCVILFGVGIDNILLTPKYKTYPCKNNKTITCTI